MFTEHDNVYVVSMSRHESPENRLVGVFYRTHRKKAKQILVGPITAEAL